jgi:phosphate/phosphite/phosphonate ABC transporter binding protein
MALAAAAALLALVPGRAFSDGPAGKPALVRVGAVASGPSSVTVWRGIQRYLAKHKFPIDYVLYSNYDALVDALKAGHVDIAWNTPLAHARYHALCGGRSQTLVMRDVDRDFRAVLLARKDSGIDAPQDLAGKTLVLGSNDAAEATVLPVYYLKKQGVGLDKVKTLSLHGELDNAGCPCSSEQDVLKALQKGRGHAGVISEAMWKRLAAREPGEAASFRVVWTSPGFSHCVFTAAADFDKKTGDRFRDLMVAMDGKDAMTAEILQLEACSKWVEGTHDGFKDLVEAIRKSPGGK